MPIENVRNFGLPSVDDLFTTQEMRDDAKLKKLHDIPITEIDDFPDHPYQVRNDEDMANLIESIKEFGVLTPATVRKKEDGRYEMLSGHRRKRACELAGLETLKCEIVDLDRDAATIFMVDSNLQRTTILPSEKARSYKMRLDAMKRQAGRPSKNNLSPVGTNLKGVRSDDLLGEAVGESKSNINRYIRLNELVPELLELVDENRIGLRPAVEISYFPKDMQAALVRNIEIEQCTPSHDQTIRMRKLLDEGRLSEDLIAYIMQEEKPNQRERVVIRSSRIKKYFPDSLPISKREEYVLSFMEFGREHMDIYEQWKSSREKHKTPDQER